MKRELKILMLLIVASSLIIYAWTDRQKFARTFKDDWHGSCKVMAFFVPLDFPAPLKYSEASNVKDGYDTIGSCEAKQMKDGLWHVKGLHYNHRMEIDRIPPINYEALMFEEDEDEFSVQRYGTQYGLCSLAIDGVDRTGSVRPNRCGDGMYILEYKIKMAFSYVRSSTL